MDRTVCRHHNRPSECQKCLDEIPSFLRQNMDQQRIDQRADAIREGDLRKQITALTARAEQLEAQVAYHKEKAELINSLEVKTEKVARERAERELANFGDRISAAIGTNDYLDPPDGGGPELAEQVRRMRTEVVRLKEIAVLSRRFMRANWCTAEYYQLQRELLDKLRAALEG